MLLTIFCPVVRSQEHLAPIMSFHLSLFKMVGLHYMPFFACHDYKDNTSSAAGLKIYRIQLSGDELRLGLSVPRDELSRHARPRLDENHAELCVAITRTAAPPEDRSWRLGARGCSRPPEQ